MVQFSRKTYSILVVITVMAATTFTACVDSSQKVENPKENLMQAQKEYRSEVAHFKKESHSRIASNDATIADFKKQMTGVKKDVKKSYEKQVEALEQKNAELKKRMDDYKEDGLAKDKWESFKSEFNHDMDELGKALKDLTVNNKK